MGFPGGANGKEAACQCQGHKGRRFNPWFGKILWRKKWQPTPAFLPGEFHGGTWRARVHRIAESDMTEVTYRTHTIMWVIQSCWKCKGKIARCKILKKKPAY